MKHLRPRMDQVWVLDLVRWLKLDQQTYWQPQEVEADWRVKERHEDLKSGTSYAHGVTRGLSIVMEEEACDEMGYWYADVES